MIFDGERRPARWAAGLVACALLGSGGCAAPGPEDAQVGGERAAPAPAGEVPRTPAPPPPRTDVRIGAAPIFAWRCESGALIHSRYRDADGSLDLAVPGSVLRLAGERSASGALWRGAGIDFFSRGAEARFVRDGVTMICQIDEAATAEARAAARGVRWRGSGNEPGWVVEIDDATIRWTTDYGATTLVAPIEEADEDAGGVLRGGRTGAGRLVVRLSETVCVDDGDRSFPLSVSVEFDGRLRRGCGRALEPLPFPRAG